MITEQDLQEAIAECEGERNPNANTCIKLAAFYTIRENLYGSPQHSYSYAAEPKTQVEEPSYDSNTEFWQVVKEKGLNESDLMPLVDELMSTLQIVQPRLYASVLRKIESLAP